MVRFCLSDCSMSSTSTGWFLIQMERRSKLQKGEKKGKQPITSLPIYQYRRKLVEAVQDNTFLVVTGETGSGKTTQLPKYLFEEGNYFAFCKQILENITVD